MATKPTAKKPAATSAQRSLADIDTSNLSPEQIAALAEETAGAGKRKPRSNANWEVHDLKGKTATERNAILDKVGESLTKPKKSAEKSHKVSTATTEKPKKAAKTPGRDKGTVKSKQKPAKTADGKAMQAKGAPPKRGRPPKDVSPESEAAAIIDKICARLSDGEPLRQICRDDNMPSWSTVYDWLDASEELSTRFARARVKGEEAIAQDCLRIADDATTDRYIDADGRDRVDQEAIQRSKLRIDTRLKLLAKWNPKKWGEKVDLSHGVQPDNPIVSLLGQINGTALPVVKNTEED